MNEKINKKLSELRKIEYVLYWKGFKIDNISWLAIVYSVFKKKHHHVRDIEPLRNGGKLLTW
jgi:hypothetical protein